MVQRKLEMCASRLTLWSVTQFAGPLSPHPDFRTVAARRLSYVSQHFTGSLGVD